MTFPTTLSVIGGTARLVHLYAEFRGLRYYLAAAQTFPDAEKIAAQYRASYPRVSLYMSDRNDSTCINGGAAEFKEAFESRKALIVNSRMETKMRNMMILADDLVLCRSDAGDGGWSLHAPGSTDEQIATGEAPYLVSGPAEWTGGDWNRPNEADYRAAAEKLAPWAAKIIPCDGGYQAFESAQDAATWQGRA